MKGLFLCDSFRMAQEPVADVEIQCLAEPWSCVVSPHPAKLVGLHDVQARDAFSLALPADRHFCRSGQHARCGFVSEGVMGGCWF